MNNLITELSTFTMLENGRMESLGAHDDMVITLALSVQATKEYRDNIVILDETWSKRLGWAVRDRIEAVIGVESLVDALRKFDPNVDKVTHMVVVQKQLPLAVRCWLKHEEVERG